MIPGTDIPGRLNNLLSVNVSFPGRIANTTAIIGTVVSQSAYL